ncbi:hypothetical protein [Streptomyces sp. NPDC093097]|uniref:hypothetical protein n=1 Tax=Streptomyces sp. NPDC093097 TaxID=3366027 RepID=UPI0038232B91
MTPAHFRSTHGPYRDWTAADYEAYEHLIERDDPALACAAINGLIVTGRRTTNGEVVVDLAPTTTAHHALALTD